MRTILLTLLFVLAISNSSVYGEPAQAQPNVEASLVPLTASEESPAKASTFLSAGKDVRMVDRGDKKVPVITTMESAEGDVSYVDYGSIGIMYEATEKAEYEMSVPFSEDMKLEGYGKFSEIQRGDHIELEYEKTVEAPDSPEMRMSKKLLKIRFISKPEPEEEKTAESVSLEESTQ